jgi:hypothetical protein
MLTKYGFRIRTRVGLVVDRLLIHGRDHDEAQRKLRQMYRDCEILECVAHHGSVRSPVTSERNAVGANYEDVLRMISR